MFEKENLICAECGFMQQSDPFINSGWTKLYHEDLERVICPKCAEFDDCCQCDVCDRFYHNEHSDCPWCFRSLIEILRAQYLVTKKFD